LIHDLHEGLAWFVVVANGAVGLWALGAHRWEHLRTRALWIATVVAQASLGVQVVLGVILQSRGSEHLDDFHAFYGFVAFATVGIIYSYRNQLRPHRYLLYGGGGLFLMGLALRSMQFSS
jgi:hypothetical protein